jgi:hypothetical protein
VFGGFVLLLFFWAMLALPVCGCGCFFDASFGVFLLGQIVLIRIRLGLRGFCLESLILAQDERWRRA